MEEELAKTVPFSDDGKSPSPGVAWLFLRSFFLFTLDSGQQQAGYSKSSLANWRTYWCNFRSIAPVIPPRSCSLLQLGSEDPVPGNGRSPLALCTVARCAGCLKTYLLAL